jgi:hypothetical protein
MSWHKYFKLANSGTMSPINGGQNRGTGSLSYNNFSSILPEVYLGHPNRIDRYSSMNAMSSDAEVSAALDIIAEFCTQNSEQNNTPFEINFKDKPTETEISIIKKQLDAWCNLNQFEKRMFKMFRNVLKYGDQIFIRDPETFKLFWVDMIDVIKIIVNESDGKVPEQYVIRNINPNFENLSVNQVTAETLYNSTNVAAGGTVKYTTPTDSQTVSRFTHGLKEIAIEAQHIVHLSLTEGLDTTWPFGTSILENIYKVFKQKELIEDAIIIYRIQRAPERRIFKIDVGDMPSHLAMAFVERIKNEIHQRRIPSANGGGCFAMNTKIPLLDGRKPTLLELSKEFEQGKENWIYSCDPITGEAVPGKITWAGVTQQSAKVIKVTLDNGESIICTPEHKFPIIGKGKVEAKDIEPLVDSLISFNTRLHSINEEKENNLHNPQYQQVFDHSTKSWKFTHRIVANYFKERNIEQNLVFLQKFENEQKRVIHHKDFKQKLDQYNHKVLSIEWLDEPIEVGTITVDGHEELHNFHTFAIEQGVYTFNSSFVDSSYQTLGVNEDYYFPIGRDGKGSSVETLPGGQNLNDIADLKFFTNKMFRGLRIPSSYLPTTADESTAVHSDGKVGTALIQEHRFNQYCKRLQSLVCGSLNTEFKAFLKWRGLNIDSSMFDIKFNEPQNFASYRQSELDSAKIQGFTQLEQFPYLAKQFLLERYLGLTEDEILKNSQLWRSENPKKDEDNYETDTNLRNVGVSSGGIDADLEGLEPEPEIESEPGMEGPEGSAEFTTGTPPPGEM